MAFLAHTFTASVDVARTAADAVRAEVASVRQLPDADVLQAQRALAELRRTIDACASVIAGEISHRSRRDLGYQGLAQREGFRTPEALVQHTTGSTSREAVTLVQVGRMVNDLVVAAEPVDPITGEVVAVAQPWLLAVGAAVTAGTLAVEAARAIRTGLGEPTEGSDGVPAVTVEALTVAAATLLADACGMDADRLFKRARQLRDELDAAGIAEREKVIHEQRAIRRVRRPDGGDRYIIDTDLESSAFWGDLCDKLTSPRRGGPRFIDPADKIWAETIATDPRSTEQYLHDAITELLRIAARSEHTDARQIIGSRPPAVRLLVTAEALTDTSTDDNTSTTARTGYGHIEGTDIPVSIATIERVACDSGYIPIMFDHNGNTIDIGREQRLYTARQRIALAARDGGCRWDNNCDRPPSWCEAHHIYHWHRDHGKTDVRDGILLCRYHHMLLHNNKWEIMRNDDGYWLIPSRDVDPEQTPRLMPSKSAAWHKLITERQMVNR